MEQPSYRINIHGKNIEITNSIRNYIEERIAKIEQFTNQILDVTLHLEVQKLDHMVDLLLHFGHFRIKVHATMLEMYSAIDKAFDRLRRKLRKWKEQIQDHHAKGVPVIEMEVNVLENFSTADDLDDEIIEENNQSLRPPFELPKVIKTKKRPLKTLRVDEAVMKMELSGDHFMLFKGEEDQALKVIYRRRDGAYGIMAPQ